MLDYLKNVNLMNFNDTKFYLILPETLKNVIFVPIPPHVASCIPGVHFNCVLCIVFTHRHTHAHQRLKLPPEYPNFAGVVLSIC